MPKPIFQTKKLMVAIDIKMISTVLFENHLRLGGCIMHIFTDQTKR